MAVQTATVLKTYFDTGDKPSTSEFDDFIDSMTIIVEAVTAASQLPAGTTAQRPGSPVNGMVRYNSTTSKLETYEAGAWANLIGASTLPVLDTTSIVEDPADTTKEMRIDVGAVAMGTVRVLIMPDQDIDLTPGTGSFATEAEGGLAATALQDLVDDTTPQLGANLDSNTFNILFDDAKGILDDSSNEQLIFQKTASAINHIEITNAAIGNAPVISAAGDDTNVDLRLHPLLTGNVYVADGTDTTKDLTFELSGATTAKTMTLVFSQTLDRTITLPDATDTLVGRATTDTLSNKTFSDFLSVGADPATTGAVRLRNTQGFNARNAANTADIKMIKTNSSDDVLVGVDSDAAKVLIGMAGVETEIGGILKLGGMMDVNGQAIGDGTRELLTFTEDGLAVNHVNIENQAIGSGPIISSVGDDANIDLLLVAKGTGVVKADGVEVVTLSGTQTITNKSIDSDNNTITNLVNADVKAAAAIALNKLAALTASEIVISDSSGFMVSAAVATYPSLAELIHVKGVTSAIQTQMDTKAAGGGTSSDHAIVRWDGTGGALIQDISNLTLSDAGLLTGSALAITIADDKLLSFGSGTDASVVWDAGTTNSSLQIGTGVGAAAASGYISIMEKADIGNANREPSGTTPDPTLRVYSADATVATDYIELSHNQTDGLVTVGVGDLVLTAGTNIKLGSNIDISGQSIISISAGDIAITPDTTGDIVLDGQKWPQADGTIGQVLKTDGSAQLSWTSAGSGDVSAAANMDDNRIVRGNGGVKGVQHSGITIDDGDNLDGANSVNLLDGKLLTFGSSAFVRFAFDSAGVNDSMQIGVDVNGTASTGHISIMERVDLANANRRPSALSTDPVLRIYSSDAIEAADYLEFFHNQTDANLVWGNGSLVISSGGNASFIFVKAASAVNFVGTINAASGSGAILQSFGGDANVDLLLLTAGTGVVKADGSEVVTLVKTSTRPLVLMAFDGMGTTTAGGGDASRLPEDRELPTNDVDIHYLAMATDEHVFWNVTMPVNWDGGTMTAIFTWTSQSGTNDVKFEIQGLSLANDDAIDAAYGTAASVEDTVLASNDTHITAATGAMTLAGGPAGGELVAIRVKRVAPAGTDKVGDVELISVKLQYTASGYGES